MVELPRAGRSEKPKDFALRWKLLIAVLAPILAISVLEGFVRLAGIVPRRTDPPLVFLGADFKGSFPNVWDDDLFWRMEPGKPFPWEGECVNPEGFRGPAFSLEKPTGVRRVVCLGDSCTFGSAVPEHATFAHRLQRWLDTSRTGRWEVVNAGVPGYTLWQEARLFELEGRILAPDVVIVYAGGWNEYTPAIGGSDVVLAEKLNRSHEGLGRLRLVQLARSWFGRRDDAEDTKVKTRYGQTYVTHGKRLDGARVPRDDYERLIGELHEACKRQGARLLFVVAPAPETTRNKYPEGEEYAAISRRVTEGRGIPRVDLRKVLGDLHRPDGELFTDIIHLSVEGHRIAFGAIASALSELAQNAPEPPKPDDLATTDLIHRPEGYSFKTGEPLLPANPADLTLQDGSVRTLVPSQFRFDDVHVPARASLALVFAHGNPRADRPEGTTLRVLVGASGSGPAPVFTHQYAVDHMPGQPETFLVDLADFAGQTITIVAEVSGTAGCGLWNDVRVEGYR